MDVIAEPTLVNYLSDAPSAIDNGVVLMPLRRSTPGLLANIQYFDTRPWAEAYLKYCHRSAAFRARWQAVCGSWAGKVVVDVGCGPGNVNANLREEPALLIGVDVSPGALELAKAYGYMPLRADAQDMPLVSGFADLVIINASVHHCDDMRAALTESARLVAPGGILVIDHDPQLSAWNFRGPGMLLWRSRLWIYKLLKKGFHRSDTEQAVALASEIHHDAGDGVTEQLFRSVLEPLGFEVSIYPHNNGVGGEVLSGERGRSSLKMRVGQRLSGIDPASAAGALSLMCRAVRR